MTREVPTGWAASWRYPLTSDQLTDVITVRGTVEPLEEKPIASNGGTAPSLYQRHFELTDSEFIRNNSTTLENQDSFLFSGFTMLAPAQRVIDTGSPTLQLEGQAFFDSKLPSESMDVLLLIGGADITPIMGFMGNSASVESGVYKDQPVRAFLIEGADNTLPQALPSLVGWQVEPTMETAQAAIQAPHPLIAIDALRIAVRSGASEQVELLAQSLLHPAQPAGVKATAIELLGEAINQMPQGSKEADKLIDVAVAGWEAERAYPIDAAYLRALQSASVQIKQSSQLERVKAIADDYQIRELTTLSEQLANSLKK